MDLLRTALAEGDPSVLHVAGEIDLSTADQLREALAVVVASDSEVVVDMTDVTFVDASGLRVLVQVAGSLNGRGPLVLENASRVEWLLDLVGTDTSRFDFRERA